MYEVERSRLKDKIKKLKETIFEQATQMSRLNVELQQLTKSYANINEQYRAVNWRARELDEKLDRSEA